MNECGFPGAGTSPTQEKKLFPIFRPKAERKTLYIIRHGESEFNAATNTGKGFSDPQIYDPKLTAKGQSQVTFCPLALCPHFLLGRYNQLWPPIYDTIR